jgi:hypothetical protein
MRSGTRTIYGRRALPMCDLRFTSENVVSTSISHSWVTVPSGRGARRADRHTPWRTIGTRTPRRHAPGAFDKSEMPTPSREALEEADRDRPDGRGDRDHEVEPTGPPELSSRAGTRGSPSSAGRSGRWWTWRPVTGRCSRHRRRSQRRSIASRRRHRVRLEPGRPARETAAGLPVAVEQPSDRAGWPIGTESPDPGRGGGARRR